MARLKVANANRTDLEHLTVYLVYNFVSKRMWQEHVPLGLYLGVQGGDSACVNVSKGDLCGVCGGQSATGTGFSPCVKYFPGSIIPLMLL